MREGEYGCQECLIKGLKLVQKIIQFSSVGFNSLFNVFVYFYRLKGLRQHVRDSNRNTKVLQRNQTDASNINQAYMY